MLSTVMKLDRLETGNPSGFRVRAHRSHSRSSEEINAEVMWPYNVLTLGFSASHHAS